jgi:hypothetical protein
MTPRRPLVTSPVPGDLDVRHLWKEEEEEFQQGKEEEEEFQQT